MPPSAPATLPADTSPHTEFRRGVKESLPMLIGLLPLALILGVQGAQKGMSVLEMPLMTGLNFAGGSEFAAVGLWGDPLPSLLIIAEGIWRGQWQAEAAGSNGFGYDPHFYLPEQGCTAAELLPEVKNQISHRGLALAELKKKIDLLYPQA